MENQEFRERYRWVIIDEHSHILEISENTYLKKATCVMIAQKRLKTLSNLTSENENMSYVVNTQMIQTPTYIDLILEVYCYLIHERYQKFKKSLNLSDQSKEHEYVDNYAMICHDSVDIPMMYNHISLLQMLYDLDRTLDLEILKECLDQYNPVEILKNKYRINYFEFGMFDRSRVFPLFE